MSKSRAVKFAGCLLPFSPASIPLLIKILKITTALLGTELGLTLREERRLRVFENNRLFRPYREEETRGEEKCIKKRVMLHNFYS
jgi:hypothetical protein